MGKRTRFTAYVLAAALLFNMFSSPVYAEQSVSNDMPVENQEIAVETTGNPSETTEPTSEATEPTIQTTEATIQATEPTIQTTEATIQATEPTIETTENSTPETNEAVGETGITAYALENAVAGERKYFTLNEVGLTEADGCITINSGADLVKLSHVNPDAYKEKKLRFVNNGAPFDTTTPASFTVNDTPYEYSFAGLDSFQGILSVASGTEDYPIKLTRPLFNTLSDQVQIQTDNGSGLLLMFVAKINDYETDIPTALLAETVKHSESPAAASWKIRVTASDSDGIMPPLIGTMEANTRVDLSVKTNFGDNTVTYVVNHVKGKNNAGLLCAQMEDGAVLTLSEITTADTGMPAVTAENGSAGSLVGNMSAGTVLTLNNAITSLEITNVTAGNGSAGGLVGYAADVTFTNIPAIQGKDSTSISGTNAGGLIGSYTYTGKLENVLHNITYSISDITVSGTYAGGFFGELNNNDGTNPFTFDPSATVSVTMSALTMSAQYDAGGLIGKYSAGSLNATLKLNQGTVKSTVNNTPNTYGGLIGWVANTSAAYIEAGPSGTITVGGTAKSFGGLIGSLSDKGHYLKVCEATITKQADIKGNDNAGGVVGLFNSGVLELSGNVTADTPTCNNNCYRGNYVGQRGNTLVFTTYKPNDGWVYNNGWNDIGNWGQVLQVYQGSGLEGLLTIQNHTVTVTGTGTAVTDQLTFAQAALRFQLDSVPEGALKVNDDFNLENDIVISLTGNIDLNGTGLTGFQRDTSKAEGVNVTLSCQNAAIAFPDITIYGGEVNNENVAHSRQGLFAETTNLTVNNENESTLTLKGHISVDAFNKNVYLGALTAESKGNVTATKVICNTNLTITSAKGEERISGLVAQQNKAGSTVALNGCKWTASITYDGSNLCYLGGLLARAENGTAITVKDCTISGSITKTGNSESYVGGLIASLRDNASDSLGNGLAINGLVADGVTINTQNSAKTGGILGWEWMTKTTDIQGVTIKNCTLNGGSARFGGLVYKGNGYWKVHDTGITFESNNSFSGMSGNDSPSGLLLADGSKLEGHHNALYLEIQTNAYIMKENSVSLNIGNSVTFDEIVGKTESADGNGIVSIGTGINLETPSAADCNYVKKLATDYVNPNTRYYYNLDVFRNGNAATGYIDSSGKLVLYSTYTHCYSGLKGYFYEGTPENITGTLNLAGYSYYPAETPKNIENAVITFDYAGLENNSRKPSDNTHQNYGMHTGLFTNAINRSVNVAGLTLKGTVGGSAIINNIARGQDSSNMTKLKISTVQLDGIRTVGTGLHPLLINGIESYTSLELTDVTTTNAYNDLNEAYAATSLIGNVGETSGSESIQTQVGQYIQLDFSQIGLDGRINADENNTPVHGTTRTIFRDALFLQNFQYVDSNSWGVYNFIKDDVKYTLGKELSNTEEDSGVRNGGEQFYFYGTEDYVYCVEVNKDSSEGTVADAGAYFKSGYRPYVNNSEASPQHQMDINLSSKDMVKGCGTYSDPYIIEYGKQLSSIAKVLNGEKPKKNWKITLNTKVLSGGLSSQDYHTNGNDTNTDITFTWDGSQWGCDGESAPTERVVIDYLRNAYYMLKNTSTEENEGNGGNIYLTSSWGGLGSATYPFQGVIVGENSQDKEVTVHISVSNGSQFGGLIAFSTGSVVKNVKIQYDQAPSIACTSVPGTIDAPFFGGVVGWCIGGDTIIDSVSVTYANANEQLPKATGDKAYLLPMGGYVGLVGGTEGLNDTTNGLGGGVVFRGENTSNFSSVAVGNTTVTPNAEDSGYFYVNPYVGRVLDGYAINEKSDFINTDKNYKILSISNPGLAYEESVNTYKVKVSNDAGLWLLSAIVNSGTGSVENVRAYSTGKARFCDYGSVGQAVEGSEGADEVSGASPYLIRKFKLNENFKTITTKAISIELTGNCDMSNYGNGFRGLGGSYGGISSGNRLLKVSSIASTENRRYTVTLQQNRKEYTDEYQTWTTLGTGLFPVLNPATDFCAERLILAGTTGITYYSESLAETVNPIPSDKKLMDADSLRLGCAGAGLLAGTMKKETTKDNNSTIDLNNITATGRVTGSATFAGGLIGLACINNNSQNYYIKSITVENCNYENLDVRGFACVGGFFGYVYADSISITSTEDYPMGGITVTSSEASINVARTGIGALIGRCGVKSLTINGSKSSPMVFSGTHTITNQNKTTSNDSYFTGGLVGLVGLRDNGIVTIQNIDVRGTVSISNKNNINNINNTSGTLAGLLIRYNTSFNNENFTWDAGGNIEAYISNIKIAQNEKDSVIVENTKQGGALFGAMMIATANLSNIAVGSDKANVTLVSGASASNSSLGGLFGTVAKANVTVVNANLTNVNVWGRPNDSNRGSALLFGYADNGAILNIRGAKLKGCNVAVNKDNTNAGIIFAEFKGENVKGYNILIDACTVGLSLSADNRLIAFTAGNGSAAQIGLKSGNAYKKYSEMTIEDIKNSASANYVALFGGNANSKTVKLVGVSVQNCNTPVKDIGKNQNAEGYIIRSDYQGSCKNESANSTGSPYVTINPVSPLVVPDKTITGDGAVFSEGTTPLLHKILNETKYYNVLTNSTNYLNSKDTTVSLSNFKNKDLNTFEENASQPIDFPVVVLQTNSSNEANQCLHSIISALTNWELCTDSNGTVTTGTKGFQSLTATSYHWVEPNEENENGRFESQNETQSLYVRDNRFYLKAGGYDNKRKQFTLVDVAYEDPTGGEADYHLYIPVVIKKMFEYKFWASAKLGTTYSVESYNGLSQPVITSHGEAVTALLNYEYQWTEAEWMDTMKNGQDLLWNFDLGVIFDPYNLPAGTEMTLIDRNYRNQAYFATATGAKVVDFKDFRAGDIAWNADRYLCDDLKLTKAQSNTGAFFLLGETKTEDATLRDVEGNYYRPANEEDSVDNRYDLTINGIGTSGKVNAQFYLTVKTPSTTSNIVNTNIQCGDELSGKLPTRRLPAIDTNKSYSQNGNENKMILGNFITQAVSVTTTRGEEKMTEMNADIPLILTTTMSFISEDANTLYNDYAAGQRLYQKYELKLTEYIDSNSHSKDLVRGTQIRVQYYLGETAIGSPISEVLPSAMSGYTMEFQWKDGELGIPANEVKDKMQLRAEVLMTYLPAARTEQFPTRSSESEDGIAVAVSSGLAYSLHSLRSNINLGDSQEAKCGDRVPHFYREDNGAASLNYVAYENQNNTVSEGVSDLGINGRDGSSFRIHSAALYNVSDVKEAENADTLRVTISLLEKQDNSTYNMLNYAEVNSIEQYLSSLEVNSYYKQGDSMKQAELKNSNSGSCSFDFNVTGYDPEVSLQIPITLMVLTGEGFNGKYANYRIKVSAQLMQGSNPIDNSIASDYIVYTNAKISQSFLDIKP